jgi:D-amino peptidase
MQNGKGKKGFPSTVFRRAGARRGREGDMRIVCSVDIEGASGIVSPKETQEGGVDYDRGRDYLTHDVNAAVEGALEAGATRIVLHDSHGFNQRNLFLEKVHPAAEVIRGLPILFFEQLKPEFDASFLIALHSSYDESKGVLNHLFSSAHFRSVRLNGRPISEGEVTAAIAGHLGIPTVLVTGDDVTCVEMRRVIPEIETVVVKHAISRFAARCLPLSQTGPLIREGAKRAVQKVRKGTIPPYVYPEERELEIELRMPYQAEVIAELTKAKLAGLSTLQYAAADGMEVYRILRLVLYLVSSSLIP